MALLSPDVQELGRAGRDGKPSLSVTFHDARSGKDASRLKFMVGKTVEGSRLDEAGRAKMLGQRIRQIDQVSTMLRSKGAFDGQLRSISLVPPPRTGHLFRSDFWSGSSAPSR